MKSRKKHIDKNKANSKKGFSLIEVLVALFVFSILVATLSSVYVNFLRVQLNAKETQRNLESAQLALNSLAKTLRTSKVIIPSVNYSAVQTVRVFDYSRISSGFACLEYNVTASAKLEFNADDVDEATCASLLNLTGTPTSLIEGRVFGGFLVTRNTLGIQAEKITTSLQICPQGSDALTCSTTNGNPVRVQTSVSLRVN